MELTVAIRLIKHGVERNSQPQRWSDWGAGEGLFSMALSSLLAPGSVIYAVDKQVSALQHIQMASAEVTCKVIHKDFVKEDTGLTKLDGVIMANALHFVEDKVTLLTRLKNLLKTTGRLILVEYDIQSPTQWVPFPVEFASLKKLVGQAGFASVTKMDEEASVYSHAKIYASLIC